MVGYKQDGLGGEDHHGWEEESWLEPEFHCLAWASALEVEVHGSLEGAMGHLDLEGIH